MNLPSAAAPGLHRSGLSQLPKLSKKLVVVGVAPPLSRRHRPLATLKSLLVAEALLKHPQVSRRSGARADEVNYSEE